MDSGTNAMVLFGGSSSSCFCLSSIILIGGIIVLIFFFKSGAFDKAVDTAVKLGPVLI